MKMKLAHGDVEHDGRGNISFHDEKGRTVKLETVLRRLLKEELANAGIEPIRAMNASVMAVSMKLPTEEGRGETRMINFQGHLMITADPEAVAIGPLTFIEQEME